LARRVSYMRWASTNIHYETSNDLYDGNIVDSVMFFVGVPDGVAKIVAKAMFPVVPFSIGGAAVGKDWIDATICDLSSSHPASCVGRMMGTLETIDTL
jgi:hypothetical protein